jgi:hypothetical protein
VTVDSKRILEVEHIAKDTLKVSTLNACTHEQSGSAWIPVAPSNAPEGIIYRTRNLLIHNFFLFFS